MTIEAYILSSFKHAPTPTLAVLFRSTGLLAKPNEKLFDNTPLEVFQASVSTQSQQVTRRSCMAQMLCSNLSLTPFNGPPENREGRVQ